jgi:sigma-E factor negative regulatory protein RseA
MSERANEISALIDDELTQADLRQEIDRLISDPAGRDLWNRYHLIGDAMRRETGPVVDTGLAEAISRKLEQEPVVLAPGAIKPGRVKWFKPVAGFAVAASVAAMAVTLGPGLMTSEQTINSPQAVAKQQPKTTPFYYVAEDGTRWETLRKPKVESRLNSYLVNHQEYAPASNMKGIMPYATFVSYDGGK